MKLCMSKKILAKVPLKSKPTERAQKLYSDMISKSMKILIDSNQITSDLHRDSTRRQILIPKNPTSDKGIPEDLFISFGSFGDCLKKLRTSD